MSFSSVAKEHDIFPEITPPTVQVDLAKEAKIKVCVEDYIAKQSRPYAKIMKETLYGLIRNFDNILLKLYGKKQAVDEVSYDEKIEVLAHVQCEAYYNMGILK
jgi:hypothetical protein